MGLLIVLVIELFVGIADSPNGVKEILFNYYKQQITQSPTQTNGETLLDLHIYKIKEEHYNYLLEQVGQFEEDIYVNFKALQIKPEEQNSNYVYVLMCDDDECFNIFGKEFTEKYDQIVSEAIDVLES